MDDVRYRLLDSTKYMRSADRYIEGAASSHDSRHVYVLNYDKKKRLDKKRESDRIGGMRKLGNGIEESKAGVSRGGDHRTGSLVPIRNGSERTGGNRGQFSDGDVRGNHIQYSSIRLPQILMNGSKNRLNKMRQNTERSNKKTVSLIINDKYDRRSREKQHGRSRREEAENLIHQNHISKLVYFMFKLRHSLYFGKDSEHKAFMDYFQKNFSDLKGSRSDKLLTDFHLKPVYLPPSIHSKLLVLDLDETLVHCCNFDHRVSESTISIPFKSSTSGSSMFSGSSVPSIKINVRPGLDRFLRKASEFYQIVVLTASDRDYAHTVIKHVDPHQYICKILTRDACSYTKNGHLVKDLRIFSGRKIEDIILVDNTMRCCTPQQDNGIPILSFFNDSRDSELEDLLIFLLFLHGQANMPQFIRYYFKYYRYDHSASALQLLEDIFYIK